MNHTKGPWTIAFGEAFHIKDTEGGSLAQMRFLKGRGGRGGRRDPNEVAANAHLIAAAPELYEALKHLQNEVRGFIGIFNIEIRATTTNTNVDCILHQLKKAAAAIAKAEGVDK